MAQLTIDLEDSILKRLEQDAREIGFNNAAEYVSKMVTMSQAGVARIMTAAEGEQENAVKESLDMMEREIKERQKQKESKQ